VAAGAAAAGLVAEADDADGATEATLFDNEPTVAGIEMLSRLSLEGQRIACLVFCFHADFSGKLEASFPASAEARNPSFIMQKTVLQWIV